MGSKGVRRAAGISLGIALALGAVMGARTPFEEKLRAKVEETVRVHCASCSFQIGRVEIFRGGHALVLRDLTYDSRGTTGDWIQASIPHLRMEVALLPSLRQRRLVIEQLSLESPKVRLVERRGPTRLAAQGDDSSGDPAPGIRIEKLELRGGEFTYQDSETVEPEKYATIRLKDIDVDVSEFGSTPELLGATVTAQARAVLENSGQVLLALRAPLVSPPRVAIELSVAGQDLEQLDPYFYPEAGITLRGQVARATASLNLSGTRLIGRVGTTYAGLEVKFHDSKERSGLKKFAESALVHLKLHKSSQDHPVAEEAISAQKRANEPYVGFLFREMEEAVLKIAA